MLVYQRVFGIIIPIDKNIFQRGETTNQKLTGAFYVGLLDGLLGVAGMTCLIVSQWIIPENSLRLAPVSKMIWMYIYIYILYIYIYIHICNYMYMVMGQKPGT